jgi:hypothetical protein
MDPRVTLISTLVKDLEKELDDIMWENSTDPRIVNLVSELNYLKEKEAKGERYEPNF